MSKLKATTDFFVWLLFLTTLLATIALLTAGVIELILHPQWNDLLLFVGSIITLIMHYGGRYVPTQ